MALEWTTFRLGDVCTKIGSGATPRGGSGVYLDQGDVALIRSQNVHNDGFHHDGIAYLTEVHAAELDNVEVQEHDVLLNITGDSVARCCQVDPGILPARVNQHVAIIRTDPEQLDPRFLRYFLVSPGMQARLLSWAGAGGTRNALTKGMIESFEVPAPKDVREQRAIAAVLEALDDRIELNRRMCRTLEGIARAIFQSWFVTFYPVRAKAAGAKRFRGMPQAVFNALPAAFADSPLGPIPKGWRVVGVGDVADINGWVLGRSDELEYIDYIEISEVMRGEIGQVVRYRRGDEPSRARRRLRHGDTVLSTVRPDRGAHFLCLNPPESLIASTGFAVMSPRDRMWAYLYSAMTRPDVSEELGRLADGGAYPAVRPEVVAGREMVVPGDPAISRAFEAVAEPLFEKAWHSRQQSKTLAAIRDALLPRLVSGEIRVGPTWRSVAVL